ncbi:MAG TPA: NAD-dependent epimerase/dehydratase family protein [Actinomycetota bacterium]
MRAFVTGATGFIGGAVARALLDDGWDLTLLVRTPSKAAELVARNAAVVLGDLADPQGLEAPMRDHDAVFHLAAWYDFGVTDHSRMERINIDGTEHVIRAAAGAGVERIVYCSSVAALGNDPAGGIGDETKQHHGRYGSFYEQTKHRAHERVRALAAEGIGVVTVMPAAVYGPGDPSLMGLLMKLYARRLLIACPFLAAGVSMVHVSDVAHGMIRAARAAPGSEYILGGDNGTVKSVFERVASTTGIRPPRVSIPNVVLRASAVLGPVIGRILREEPGMVREAAATMTGSWMFTSARAQRDLGYSYRPVEEGIPPMVAGLRRPKATAG